MKRTITYPYWGNDQKTQIICWFNYEDGTKLEVSVTDTENGNPDWKEIMETFTIEQIDETTNHLLEEKKKKEQLDKQKEIESRERFKTDALFAAKLEAFEIPSVRDSKNRKLKSAIRKAQSITEIQAYTTILMLKEMDAEDEAAATATTD